MVKHLVILINLYKIVISLFKYELILRLTDIQIVILVIYRILFGKYTLAMLFKIPQHLFCHNSQL